MERRFESILNRIFVFKCLFLEAVERIHTAYSSGRYDNADSNFFYDYLALLGTMQNQHFFSQKQTEKMLGWIKEATRSKRFALKIPFYFIHLFFTSFHFIFILSSFSFYVILLCSSFGRTGLLLTLRHKKKLRTKWSKEIELFIS